MLRRLNVIRVGQDKIINLRIGTNDFQLLLSAVRIDGHVDVIGPARPCLRGFECLLDDVRAAHIVCDKRDGIIQVFAFELACCDAERRADVLDDGLDGDIVIFGRHVRLCQVDKVVVRDKIHFVALRRAALHEHLADEQDVFLLRQQVLIRQLDGIAELDVKILPCLVLFGVADGKVAPASGLVKTSTPCQLRDVVHDGLVAGQQVEALMIERIANGRRIRALEPCCACRAGCRTRRLAECLGGRVRYGTVRGFDGCLFGHARDHFSNAHTSSPSLPLLLDTDFFFEPKMLVPFFAICPAATVIMSPGWSPPCFVTARKASR